MASNAAKAKRAARFGAASGPADGSAPTGGGGDATAGEPRAGSAVVSEPSAEGAAEGGAGDSPPLSKRARANRARKERERAAAAAAADATESVVGPRDGSDLRSRIGARSVVVVGSDEGGGANGNGKSDAGGRGTKGQGRGAGGGGRKSAAEGTDLRSLLSRK